MSEAREIRDLVLSLIQQDHNVSPATIQDFDEENMRARVKLKWKDEQGAEPVIEDAPVATIRAGGLAIIPPYQSGDEVLCVFSDVDLESTLGDDTERRPLRAQAGQMDYCMVVGGLTLDTEALSVGGDSSSLRIGTEDGSGVLSIDPSGAVQVNSQTSVKVDSPSVQLGSGTVQRLVTEAFQAAFNAHTHPSPAGGSTGPPSAQLLPNMLTTNTEAS